jgi:hypothetical protein
VPIIAAVGQADPETYTCGICGFVYSERGECPRCKLVSAEGDIESVGEGSDILDQVRELSDGAGGEGTLNDK